MSLAKTIGKRVKAIRTGNSDPALTHEALAARTGLTVSYLQLLERGERLPNLETLGVLAQGLGARLADLVSAEDDAERIDESLRAVITFCREKGLGNADVQRLLAVAKVAFQ